MTELETYAPPEAAGLFGTNDPERIVLNAAAVADELARVVEDRRLYVAIRGRKHIRVEGWTLLGALVGVFPYVVWSRRLAGEIDELTDGWEARVEARTLAGQLVGAAESQCDHSEERWRDADEYALRSMAQTRATGRALKGPLGFVFALAGYETTPAEEMPVDEKPRMNEKLGHAPAEAEESITGLRLATDAQMRRMFALFNERGFTGRDERLAFSTTILGRPIESAKDLTMEEASRLMDAIESIAPADPLGGSE